MLRGLSREATRVLEDRRRSAPLVEVGLRGFGRTLAAEGAARMFVAEIVEALSGGPVFTQTPGSQSLPGPGPRTPPSRPVRGRGSRAGKGVGIPPATFIKVLVNF